MASRIRLGGALALLSDDAHCKANRIKELEAERDALESSLNTALQRTADATAEKNRVTSLLDAMKEERDKAIALASLSKAEVVEVREKAHAQQVQHDVLLERLQQLIRDLAIAEERNREGSADVVRMSRITQEMQGEISVLFEECAAQRARADAASATLSAALAEEKSRNAMLTSTKARKEVRSRV